MGKWQKFIEAITGKSIMLKIIICLSILAFTSGCGYYLARKYRQRKIFFNQYELFNEHFLQEVRSFRRPLQEFISARHYKAEFEDLLQIYIKLLGKNVDLYNEFEVFTFLTVEERREIAEYFNRLGRSDSDSQTRFYDEMKGRIGSLVKNANDEYRKYADLYVKLGVLIGLAIIIIII